MQGLGLYFQPHDTNVVIIMQDVKQLRNPAMVWFTLPCVALGQR